MVGDVLIDTRLQQLDRAIAQVKLARDRGVNDEESESLADIERQALIFIGLLQDMRNGQAALNGLEAQVVLANALDFCELIERGLAEVTT